MTAAERIAFSVTYDTVQIVIDGETVYSGGVEELRSALENHVRFMDYIDSHEEDE